MNTSKSALEQLFEMFAQGAMRPREYKATALPKTITVTVKPETMELLHTMALRIGTTRANVASHILQIGAIEAAVGCGFHPDEEDRIPDSEKKWDVTPKTMGFRHTPEIEEN